MSASEGLLGAMRIGMNVVGYLTGIEFSGTRAQEPVAPFGEHDTTRILLGPRDIEGTARHAYMCGEWLGYFMQDDTEFDIEIYPGGLFSDTCLIAGRMVLKGYRLLEMAAESNMAVLEEIGFDIYRVGTGASDLAQEIVHWVKDPDTTIGRYSAIDLPDDADVQVNDGFQIEDSLIHLGHVYVLVIPGGTGNLRYHVDTNFGDPCSELYTAHSDSIAATQVAVTVNQITCIDITAAFTGVALGDVVGLEFTREGSHALDTVNADCYYLGILLTRA